MASPTLMPLKVRQTAVLDGYRYSAEDLRGTRVGEIVWPAMAQARNARVRWHGSDPAAGAVKLVAGRETSRVEFEYLDRGWVNDVRYTLMSQDSEVAVAELRFASDKPRAGRMTLLKPLAAQLVRRQRWLRQRMALVTPAGIEIGRIEDAHAISLVRELRADLPSDWPLPVRLFAVYLALQLIHTQV